MPQGDIFGDTQNAVASLLRTTPDVAGFILGFAVILTVTIALAWVMKTEKYSLYLAIVGMAFVVLIGWWPPWSILFIALFIALLVYHPFGLGGGED